MIEKFRWINSSVVHQLESIMATQKVRADRGDGSDDDSINAKDFINEFENDQFKQRNIRVRPESSMSHGRHLVDDKSEHQSRHLQSTGEGDDENYQKFNTDVMHDIQLIRRERKDFLLAQEEKKRAELEKAEKKKKKV